MDHSQRIFTRYRFPLFFLLSYLLSWWLLPVSRQGLLSHGPAIAAVIVLALTSGRAGLGRFWSRVTRFDGGWWYLVGPAILAGGLVVAFLVNLLLGASLVGPPRFPLVAVGALLIFGGAWEELGWSGYALPALQRRFATAAYGALVATLVLGLFRAIWHLPLVIVGAISWYDAVLLVPLVFQPIVTWLYNRSGGSVPVVWVFHYASNLFGVVVGTMFSGPEQVQYIIIYYVYGFLFTAVLAWRTRFRFGWRADAESMDRTG